MAPRKTATTKYAEDGTPLPTRKEFYKRYIGVDLSAEELQKRVDAQLAGGGFSDPLPPAPAPAFSLPPDTQKNPGVGLKKRALASPAPPKPASASPKPAPQAAKVDDEPAAMDLPWIPKPKPATTPQAQLNHYHKQFGGLPREKSSAYDSAEAKRIKNAGGWEAVEDNETFLDPAKRVHSWIDED